MMIMIIFFVFTLSFPCPAPVHALASVAWEVALHGRERTGK
jgi:hypothetical protein